MGLGRRYPAEAGAESAIEQIVQRGTIRIGMDVFVPWAMKDKKGELIGLEIDVAQQLAKDMGVKVEFVPTKWSGIIPSLIAGKFDVIIGGMTATRRAQYEDQLHRTLLPYRSGTAGQPEDDRGLGRRRFQPSPG